MNLEKLFWSETRVDILEYLIFRRQGISMRALEAELWWTFPAIKKQIDTLEEAWVIHVEKDPTGFSIHLEQGVIEIFKNLFFESLKQDLIKLFENYWDHIINYYRWDRFWKIIWTDIVILYKEMSKEDMEKLKWDISECCRKYKIENISLAAMNTEEREKRYRLADRFVLKVIREYK